MRQLRCNSVFVLTLLVVTQVWSLASVGQTPSSLLIFQEADDDRSITRTFSNSTFEWPLTLLNNAAQPSAPVTFTLGPITRTDDHAGKPAQISLKNLEKELIVKSHAYSTITLEGELPEFASYRSWIIMTSGESSIVYDLKLERKMFQLVFPAATNNRLELSISSRNIDVPIAFKLADGQPELSQLQFSVSSFARLDGRSSEGATLKIVQPDALTLMPGQFQTVHLTGTNLRPGKYWAGLNIRNQDSGQDSGQWLDVQLNYAESTQRITVIPVTDTGGELWYWGNTAKAELTIDEAAGQSAQIYTPHLESIERVSGANRPLNLADVHFTITPRRVATDANDPTGAITTIDEHDSQQWTLTLGNLSAGKYKAIVSVAGPDLPKASSEFHISMRHSFLYALIAIGVGVGLSFWLHNYLQGGRDRKLRQATVAGAVEQIRKDQLRLVDPVVWPELLAQLSKLPGKLRIAKTATDLSDLDAVLKDILDRRTYNLSFLSAQLELTAILSTYPSAYQKESEELQAEGRRLQNDMQGWLTLPLLADQQTKVKAHLVSYEQLLDKARRTRFALPTKELLTEVESFRDWVSKDAGRSPSFLGRMDGLVKKLATLSAAVESGVWAGVDGRLNDISSEYHLLRMEDLEAQLNKWSKARRIDETLGRWQAFDAALAVAQTALQTAKSDASIGSQKTQLLRSATLKAQLAQIEYLQVAIRNCPIDFSTAQWKLLIDNEVSRNLVSARQAVEQDSESGAAGAINNALAAYTTALKRSITLRKSELDQFVRSVPQITDETHWKIALDSAPFKAALELLQAVGQTPDLNHLQLEREFVTSRVNLLRCATNACLKLLPNADAGNRDRLTSIVELLNQADANLAIVEYSDELLPEMSLQNASQQASQAQMMYHAFVAGDNAEGVQESVPASRSRASQGALVGMVQIAASVPESISSNRPLPPSTELPETEDDILKAVERNDGWGELIAVALATFAGLNVLYFNNEAWGTVADYFVAVTWGFGTSEASKSALSNLVNLGVWPKAKA